PWQVIYSNGGQNTVELYASNAYCGGEAFASVEVPAIPQSLPIPQSQFCEGLTVTFTANEGGATIYQWNPGDGSAPVTTTTPEYTYTYDDYGTYTMTLTVDPPGECADETSVQIVVLPPDPITGGITISEPDICDTIPTLQAVWNGEGATSINWNFGDGGASSENNTSYVYDSPGTYTVVLEAYNEICDVTEQFTAEVQVGLGPIVTELIIPNVFTPNNDNKNRLFRVAYSMEEEVLPEGRNFFDYLSMYRLLIYNRWGNLVYDSDVDGLQGWDGGDNRDDTESTFYFILEYQRKCLDEAPIRREGHLTLLRK
ncbi:MAG: hypothetical protein RL220_1276, partial [Bacteroidota bacterium]